MMTLLLLNKLIAGVVEDNKTKTTGMVYIPMNYLSFMKVTLEQESMVFKKLKGKRSHSVYVILLDSGSTPKANIMNPNLVTDIIMIINPVVITNNAITKRITLDKTVKGLVHDWFDTSQVANIFSFSHLRGEN